MLTERKSNTDPPRTDEDSIAIRLVRRGVRIPLALGACLCAFLAELFRRWALFLAPPVQHWALRRFLSGLGPLVSQPILCANRTVYFHCGSDFVQQPTCREDFFGPVASQQGLVLEIGPLHTPICKRPKCNVRYLDVFTTDELRTNYADDPQVPVGQIVDIDYVWKGERYNELMSERFDCVVSSHNIEHVPCLVSFLANLSSCLVDGGRVFLAIPDKRTCFDHFKIESSVVDVLEAHYRKDTRPPPSALLRHLLLRTHNDSIRHWKGDHGTPDLPEGLGSKAGVMQLKLQQLHETTDYIDTHTWVFTPGSFAEIVQYLFHEGLTGLETERLYPTEYGSHEFYAVLIKQAARS